MTHKATECGHNCHSCRYELRRSIDDPCITCSDYNGICNWESTGTDIPLRRRCIFIDWSELILLSKSEQIEILKEMAEDTDSEIRSLLTKLRALHLDIQDILSEE